MLIKINSRLKDLPECWFKSTHDSRTIWNIDFNQVMTQWFESTVDLIDLYVAFTQFRWHFFGLSLNFADLFGTFTKFRWPFLWAFDSSALIRINSWLKLFLEDVNRFNPWLKRLSRNWLRINLWLKLIPHALFRSTHDSKCFPIFRFKLTHNSSEKHSILNRLMIRLWVISMSATYRFMQKYWITNFDLLPLQAERCLDQLWLSLSTYLTKTKHLTCHRISQSVACFGRFIAGAGGSFSPRWYSSQSGQEWLSGHHPARHGQHHADQGLRQRGTYRWISDSEGQLAPLQP